MNYVELLAPAKDYISAVAAVDYGADAIYIGGVKFGARYAAANSVQDIARTVEYARRYGVRVYATLNTLIFDDELAEAQQQAHELIAAGVDALIVQDMAFRQMNLPIELHASTQTAIMTAEQAQFLGEAGFARIILERALSIEQIRNICAATSAEVECFVHGAICVGYSGRCFLSRSMSDRSGNRGACSQPCRLTYDLTDGKGRVYLAGKHLLSLRDLNLSSRVGELLDAGVRSLKIEGRLKEVNYIKNIVAHYRRAVDSALEARPHLKRSSVGESVADFTPAPCKSFTRGESEYFFSGKRAGVASFDTPKSVGEYIGRVVSVGKNGCKFDRAHNLSAGDGICFITPAGVIGTNINGICGERIIPNRLEGISIGAEVYRNYDHRFNRALESSRTRRVIPVSAVVEVAGEGISIKYTDCTGISACVERQIALEKAKNPAANGDTLRIQAAKGGDTIFAVRSVAVSGEEWFVPASLIAELRREGLEKLLQTRSLLGFKRTFEGRCAKYPSDSISAEESVTNHLAEAFYRGCGVVHIERGLDLAASTANHRVMRSAYCIRREIGECLKEKPRLKGDLWLERGAMRYKLEFDCDLCEMSLRDVNGLLRALPSQ